MPGNQSGFSAFIFELVTLLVTKKPMIPDSQSPALPAHHITKLIRSVRDRRVILDADLARIYGVETRALNQAVKRNLDRFPADCFFQLTAAEKNEVITNCDHL